MRLHCLQHLPFDDAEVLTEWAEQRGHELKRTNVFDDGQLPSLGDFDALIILGGLLHVHQHDVYPWLVAEKQLIRDCIDGDRPILGICLGGQLIADVLGAKVGRGEKEIGWYPIDLTPDARRFDYFADWPDRIRPLSFHTDAFDLPPGAVRIARSELCPDQGFTLGGKIIGLQFHIEYTIENIKALVETVAERSSNPALVESARSVLNEPDRVAPMRELFEQLLDRAVIEWNK